MEDEDSGSPAEKDFEKAQLRAADVVPAGVKKA